MFCSRVYVASLLLLPLAGCFCCCCYCCCFVINVRAYELDM